MEKKNLSKVLAGAALAGLIAGSFGVSESAFAEGKKTEGKTEAKKKGSGCSGADGCGGKNGCKGKDGCGEKKAKKDGKDGCNGCKGKDGCGEKHKKTAE